MKIKALLLCAGLCFAVTGAIMSTGCDKQPESTATTKPKSSRPKVATLPKGGEPMFADDPNTKPSK